MKSKLLRRIILTACCFGVATLSPVFAAPKNNVLNVKTDIDPSKIVNPESFEVDVDEILNQWHVKRYTTLEKDVLNRKTKTFTDEEYRERLERMPTEIDMTYHPVVVNFIKMYVERRKGLVESMLALNLFYKDLFYDAFTKEGLPLELTNLAIIESALNPTAVSKAGATGLWQFMSQTAHGEGLEINSLVDERRDPYKSTYAAAKFLKKLYKTYGDWSLAIAAYNCGPGNVNKAIRRAGGGKKTFWDIYNYLPKETRDYIPAFIAANYAMHYYRDHNISPVLASKPIRVDTVHVNNKVSFNQISSVLDIPIEELRILNPQYKKDVIPGNVKPYSLVLPHLQVYNYIANEDSILNYGKKATPTPKKNASPSEDLNKISERNLAETSTPKSGNDSPVSDDSYIYHKVGRDETVDGLAKKYNVPAGEIVRANGGSYELRRGTNLQIRANENAPVVEPAKANSERAVAQTTAQPSSPSSSPASTVAKSNEMPKSVTTPANANKSEAQQKVTNAFNKAQVNTNKTQSQQTQTTNYKKPAAAATKAQPQATQTKAAAPAKQQAAAKTPTPAKQQAAAKQQPAAKQQAPANNKNGKQVAQAKPDPKAAQKPDPKAAQKQDPKAKNAKPQQPAKAPEPKQTTYTTKSGDNLEKIARQNGISVADLKKANGMKNDLLPTGKELKIPKAKPAPKKDNAAEAKKPATPAPAKKAAPAPAKKGKK